MLFRIYLKLYFRLILIFFFFVGLVSYIFQVDKFSENSIINCYSANRTISSSEYVSFNMIFVESNLKRKEIGIKQMCCIESAAKNNPLASIQVYTLNAQLNPNATYLLEKYLNVQIIQFDAKRFISQKNVLSFWKNGTIHRSKFSYSHLSDFLRLDIINFFYYVILYKVLTV